MNYQFSVKKTKEHDMEVAVIKADNLKEAKKKFAEEHPEDIKNIDLITSDDGYEEII